MVEENFLDWFSGQGDLGISVMPKWHFRSNSRIIWVFPPCSEGSHIASSFFEETSPKHAARIGPFGLILCLFLSGLFSRPVFAAPQAGPSARPQAGQIIEGID